MASGLLNTNQIAGNVKASVVHVATAESLVSFLSHVFLQRRTIFEDFLTVKTFQTVQPQNITVFTICTFCL